MKTRKTKKFPAAPGPEVLPDEYFLGMLIQNAAARGLRACRGSYYRDAKGLTLCKPSVAMALCCAEGARRLEPDTGRMSGLGLVKGNDNYDDAAWWWPAYSVGAAFYEALS